MPRTVEIVDHAGVNLIPEPVRHPWSLDFPRIHNLSASGACEPPMSDYRAILLPDLQQYQILANSH